MQIRLLKIITKKENLIEWIQKRYDRINLLNQ